MLTEFSVTGDYTHIYEHARNIIKDIPPEVQENRVLVNPFDAAYHALMAEILQNGSVSAERTNTGTIKVSGPSLQFDMSKAFPLITSKFTWFAGVQTELAWFLRGETNIASLSRGGVKIWNEWPYVWFLKRQGQELMFPRYTNEWQQGFEFFNFKIDTDDGFARKWGELGPVYGSQWRRWRSKEGREIDQLGDVIENLRDPERRYSRRLMVTAWNPADVKELSARSLPPCHALYQFVVTHDRNKPLPPSLNCVMYQRSCDVFLGLPFNIASYALLTHLIANKVGMTSGKLTIHLGDAHIYLNHLDQVERQFNNISHRPPSLIVDTGGEELPIEGYSGKHIQLIGYQHSGRIKAPIAV